jgi:hypothetical protein
MPTPLPVVLDRLAQIHTSATARRARQNYTDETHLVFLSLDLRELLRDVHDSITHELTLRPGPEASRRVDPGEQNRASA